MDPKLVNKEIARTESKKKTSNAISQVWGGEGGWREFLAYHFQGKSHLCIIFSFTEYSSSSWKVLASKWPQLLLKLPWEHIDISKHSHNYQKMRRPKAVKPSLQGQWLQNETGNVYQQAQRLAGWALLGSVMINIHSRMLNHTKNIRSPNHRGGQWGTQSQIIQWPPSSARKMRNSRKTKLRISLLSIFW